MGNKADVSGNDLLQYWEDDPDTDVILLYLESFGNPRKFARLARRVSRQKPIVAVKSGRTNAGTRALRRTRPRWPAPTSRSTRCSTRPASSASTRSRSCSTPRRCSRTSRCRRAGASRSSATAAARRSSRPTRARRSVCEVPELSPSDAGRAAHVRVGRRRRPQPDRPRRVRDERDLRAGAADRARRSRHRRRHRDLRAAARDPGRRRRRRRGGGRRTARAPSRSSPASSAATAPSSSCRAPAAEARAIPSFAFPEGAAAALAPRRDLRGVARPDRGGSCPTLPGVDEDAARALVDDRLASHPEGEWLDPELATGLCRCFGVPVVETVAVSSADAAADAAGALGFPVALKAGSGRIVHKTDVGGGPARARRRRRGQGGVHRHGVPPRRRDGRRRRPADGRARRRDDRRGDA